MKPLKLSIVPFPESFQDDMDQTFEQAAALYDGTQSVHPEVFPPPQVPQGTNQLPPYDP